MLSFRYSLVPKVFVGCYSFCKPHDNTVLGSVITSDVIINVSCIQTAYQSTTINNKIYITLGSLSNVNQKRKLLWTWFPIRTTTSSCHASVSATRAPLLFYFPKELLLTMTMLKRCPCRIQSSFQMIIQTRI